MTVMSSSLVSGVVCAQHERGSKGRFATLVASLLGVSVLAACGGPKGPDPYALMTGETIYKMECAICHGVSMEGQTQGTTAKADGSYLAPPLNAAGKIFGAPRDKLLAVVKQGSERTPEGHAFAKKMTERQLDSVAIFIENRWAAEASKQAAAASSKK